MPRKPEYPDRANAGQYSGIYLLPRHRRTKCRIFALGLALNGGSPAAICCTSGTALLNIHPAVAEAFYQQVPLVVISADRPAAWIGQMDGQTLPQPGVFGSLVKNQSTCQKYRVKKTNGTATASSTRHSWNLTITEKDLYISMYLSVNLFQATGHGTS